MAAGSLGGALSQKFSIPGSPLVTVVSAASGDLRQPALARGVAFAFSRVLDALPWSRFASFATTGDRAFLSPDHRTEYALIFTPEGRTGQLSGGLLDAARRAARSVSVAGPPVEVTGMDALGRPARKAWAPAWGRFVTRHRFPAAALGIAVLAALSVAATGIHFGNTAANSLANQGPARAGLVALERARIGAGSLSPIDSLVPAGMAARQRQG